MQPHDAPMTDRERLLCQVIRNCPQPSDGLASALHDPLFYALAARTNTGALIAHSFSTAPEEWRSAHDANQRRIIGMFAELDEIALQAGVPIILLENGAVARVWPCQGCFSFGDLDVVVRRKDIPKLDHVLKSRGCDRSAGNGRLEYQSEALTLNVQAGLVTGVFSKLLRQPEFEELHSNSSGGGVRLLRPEYMLMQLCMHAVSHWYVCAPGIQLYRDICWYLRSTRIQWPVFTKLCRKFGVERLASHALNIAHAALAIEIPECYTGATPIMDLSKLFSPVALSVPTKLNLLRRMYWTRPPGLS
jgi:hypothetical protein